MILIDLNQTMISAFMAHVSQTPGEQVTEDLFRHIVLSALLHYKQKFSEEFGNLVLCDDDKNYWRRDIFPQYKQNREKTRYDSKFDWKLIFNTLDTVKTELVNHFPYKLIKVERAEADDIIAVLCETYQDESIVIVSKDRDFLQLQKYPHVRQYAASEKRFISTDNPQRTLLEKVLYGDRGDGIPNIRSDGDTFMVAEKRQAPFGEKAIEKVLKDKESFNTFMQSDPKIKENYLRNSRMIDFTHIPKEIKEKIIHEFESQNPKKRGFVQYFIDKNLRILAQSAHQF